MPPGATHSSLTSYTAPQSTTAATYHCKLHANARRVVDGVRLRIQAALRSRCKYFCKLCCQGCKSTCALIAETQRGAPAKQTIGARAARKICKLRRTSHAVRARRSRLHAQSKPRARSPRRASDRAREQMTATFLWMAHHKCCARDLRAVVAHTQRCNCELTAAPDATRSQAHT